MCPIVISPLEGVQRGLSAMTRAITRMQISITKPKQRSRTLCFAAGREPPSGVSKRSGTLCICTGLEGHPGFGQAGKALWAQRSLLRRFVRIDVGSVQPPKPLQAEYEGSIPVTPSENDFNGLMGNFKFL